jgi:hypothetical protein
MGSQVWAWVWRLLCALLGDTTCNFRNFYAVRSSRSRHYDLFARISTAAIFSVVLRNYCLRPCISPPFMLEFSIIMKLRF